MTRINKFFISAIILCCTISLFNVQEISAQTKDTTIAIDQTQAKVISEIVRTLVGQKQFDTIPSGKNRIKYTIENDAKPFVFSTGESRVALFKLPEYIQPYTLTVASLCDCAGFKKKIFVPVGVFLDSGFRSSRVLLETDFKELNAGRSKPYRLETDILIDENRKDYYYLLIATQGEATGLVQKTASANVNTSGIVGILPMYINIKIRRAIGGDIILEAKATK